MVNDKTVNRWGVKFVLEDLAFREHCRKLMRYADMLRGRIKDKENFFRTINMRVYFDVWDLFDKEERDGSVCGEIEKVG